MPAVPKEAVDVAWEDQRRICAFGRMHRRFIELVEEISCCRRDLEQLNDAEDEIIIADELKMVIGETMFSLDVDDAQEQLKAKKEQVQRRLAMLEQEHAILDQGLRGLKAQLYAEFGDNIYLENE